MQSLALPSGGLQGLHQQNLYPLVTLCEKFGLPQKQKGGKKVPCDPSLHARSLISDYVRSN